MVEMDILWHFKRQHCCTFSHAIQNKNKFLQTIIQKFTDFQNENVTSMSTTFGACANIGHLSCLT